MNADLESSRPDSGPEERGITGSSDFSLPISKYPRLEKIHAWLARHPIWILILLTVGVLSPQLAKPFNIDDSLFLWEARQIQSHPCDPFGFSVNWFGASLPMSDSTENPPGASYYLAATASLLGWSEVAVHSVFLLPALAVILGTWRLARRLCKQPLMAAALTLFTPVFLVSGNTVMSDVLMLAFWIWAVVLWLEGLEDENYLKLSVAATLVALSLLSKYYGICLLPLLTAYSLAAKRRFGRWAACMIIPLAAMCAYQWITHALYGRALMTDTIEYTAFAKGIVGVSRLTSGLLALTYTGGCVAAAAFFLPLVWRTRPLIFLCAGMVLLALVIGLQHGLLRPSIPLTGAARWFTELQTVFWATIGLAVLMLAAMDLWKRRDALSLLLCLWVLGTFLFAAFINWTVNGRSILPLAPAVGILLARAWDQKTGGQPVWTFGSLLALAGSAALAWLVARSDMQVAEAAQQSAQTTFAKYGNTHGKLWFQGHWGFQYYMDLMGAHALDMQRVALNKGDILAVPIHNCYIFEPKPELADLVEVLTFQGPRWITTWSADVGAGFYSFPGPMPFAFGSVQPDQVAIYRWKTNSLSPTP